MSGTNISREANNILPLSIEKKSVSIAFKEWQFRGVTKDMGIASACCELCDQEKLRYQFQIQNKYTRNKLWVGSSCIFKFSIEVFNELGLLLDNSEAKRHLSALTKELQQTACLSALSSLADNEESGILKTALQSYKEKGYLSPKQASVVFWRLKEHNIEYNPSFFKISLGRTKYKQDLAAMDSWRVYVFWDALTSDQRKIAQSLGHKVPATSTR
jgi:hypothetical protein